MFPACPCSLLFCFVSVFFASSFAASPVTAVTFPLVSATSSPAESSIPALEGILIKTTEQGIELCGYNLELGMKTTIKANIAEPGKAVLSAKLFGEIVRRLPADDVHLTTDESNITVIQSGPSEFSLVGIPAEEYPELPAIPEDDSIEITHSLLKSMIKQTIYAVADNHRNKA
ncbi:MAG: hypothetical protein EGQ79_00725 [Ruminococcus sp.]|nr:hypothetical protein [Ruminococcus sp.]